MNSKSKRLRELAKLHRDLAEVVTLGCEQRLALAAELEQHADQLETESGESARIQGDIPSLQGKK